MTGSKPDRRLRDVRPIKTRMTTTIIRPAQFNEGQAVSTTRCLEALDEQARRLRLPSELSACAAGQPARRGDRAGGT